MTMQTPTSVKPPANCTFSVFAKYYRSIFANGTDEDFLDHAHEAFGKHQRGEDVAPAPVPTPPTTKPRVGVLVFSDLSSQISSSTARFGSENGNTATSSEPDSQFFSASANSRIPAKLTPEATSMGGAWADSMPMYDGNFEALLQEMGQGVLDASPYSAEARDQAELAELANDIEESAASTSPTNPSSMTNGSSTRGTTTSPKTESKFKVTKASSAMMKTKKPVNALTTDKSKHTPKRPRRQKQQVTCHQCVPPKIFSSQHEFKRHQDRKHEGLRFKIVDITEDQLLKGCNRCERGHLYGASYNATAHLLRKHVQPKKPKPNQRYLLPPNGAEKWDPAEWNSYALKFVRRCSASGKEIGDESDSGEEYAEYQERLQVVEQPGMPPVPSNQYTTEASNIHNDAFTQGFSAQFDEEFNHYAMANTQINYSDSQLYNMDDCQTFNGFIPIDAIPGAPVFIDTNGLFHPVPQQQLQHQQMGFLPNDQCY